MALVPLTEEDRPAVERMILQCKRLRERHAATCEANAKAGCPELDEVINGLMIFGAMRGWWDHKY